MKTWQQALAVVATALAAAACGTDDTRMDDRTPAPAPDEGTAIDATAGAIMIDLIGSEGQPVGTARLREDREGVAITIEARGLPPGRKGFHIHETGRCDPPGFQSAGGHFAPQDRQHGLDNPAGPHAGDMENLEVGADGSVTTTVVNPRVTLRRGAANSLLDGDGTALVIHAEEDDQRTDPTGDSGDRIACGVVAETAASTPL
jgi:superoxide dismutase, Cu-Zn family